MSQSIVKSSQVHLQLGQILLKCLVQKGPEQFSQQLTVLPNEFFFFFASSP